MNHCAREFEILKEVGVQVAVKKIWHKAGQLLYPSKCMECGKYILQPYPETPLLEHLFCSGCMEQSEPFVVTSPVCPCCGEIMPAKSGRDHLCERCLKTPLRLGRVHAAGRYQGALKKSVQQLKYHSELSVASALEHLLFDIFKRFYSNVNIHLLIPIPLHHSRLIERSYNQSWLLVRHFKTMYQSEFGKLPDWEISIKTLMRTKKTSPQAGLDIDKRKQNLKEAFHVVDPGAIKHRHLLLIDDVFTTGATCNAAAEVLLRNGAAKVDALVLART